MSATAELDAFESEMELMDQFYFPNQIETMSDEEMEAFNLEWRQSEEGRANVESDEPIF